MSIQKRALRSTGYSVAVLLALAGLALAVDRGLAAIFVALICLVGLPCLLLSLIDLGKALRSQNGGDFRATRGT